MKSRIILIVLQTDSKTSPGLPLAIWTQTSMGSSLMCAQGRQISVRVSLLKTFLIIAELMILIVTGNLVADVMVDSTGADAALLNSGTLRSNAVHPQGAFSNKDLLRILPLFDQLTVLSVTGVFVIFGRSILIPDSVEK